MDYLSTFKPIYADFQEFSAVAILWRLFDDETALLFWRSFRGERVYVPMHPKADHPLSLLLGHDRAKALGEELGRVRDCVPLLRDKQRVHDIKSMLAAGNSVRVVMTTLSVSERAVSDHQKAMRADGSLPHRERKAAKPFMASGAKRIDRALVLNMNLAGASRKEIAKAASCSSSYVSQFRRQMRSQLTRARDRTS